MKHLGLLLPLLAACATGTEVPQEAVSGTVPIDTGVAPTEHDGFVPYAFAITEARFGIDAEALQVVSTIDPRPAGGPEVMPISVTVLLTDASGAQTGQFTEDNHCVVVMEHPGPLPYAPWTGDAGAWFAFEISESTGTTDCGRLDFPPDWGDNPAEHVTKWVWGAGVNPISQVAIDLLGDSYDDLAPFVVGSGYHWEALPTFPGSDNAEDYADGYIDVGIAFGYQVVDGTLVTTASGDRVFLDADAMVASGEASTGWYEIQVPRLLTPASVLLDEP